MKQHRTLYKRDTSGRIRVWFVEQDGEKYRFVHGLQGGALVRSEWTVAVPKSRPTAEAQADFEVQAAYEHQLERDYFETPEETATPRYLEPMLAAKYTKWPGPGYAQPKLDGFRCIARAEGLFSREGQPFVSVPHISKVLEPLFSEHPDLILDGELYNHALKEDFEEISSICRKTKDITPEELRQAARLIEYHVYDCPSHPGGFFDRTHFLFGELRRLGLVEQVGQDPIKIVPTVYVHQQADFDRFFEQWLDEGYEGGMYRADAPYQVGKRSKHLQKRKLFEDDEFEVVRIEEGTGNWAGLAKKVICRLPDGREFGAGIKGGKAFAKRLLGENHKVVTLRFKGRTGYGIPRHAIAIKWHGEGRTQ